MTLPRQCMNHSYNSSIQSTKKKIHVNLMSNENVSRQDCEKYYEIHVVQNHAELCVAIYETEVVRQLIFCVKHFSARLLWNDFQVVQSFKLIIFKILLAIFYDEGVIQKRKHFFTKMKR